MLAARAAPAAQAVRPPPSRRTTGEGSEGYTLGCWPGFAEIYEQWASERSRRPDSRSPWRRWDRRRRRVDQVRAQCHSATGFLEYAADGLVTGANSQPLPLGLECAGVPHGVAVELTSTRRIACLSSLWRSR